jgi:hypothetical protein
MGNWQVVWIEGPTWQSNFALSATVLDGRSHGPKSSGARRRWIRIQTQHSGIALGMVIVANIAAKRADG